MSLYASRPIHPLRLDKVCQVVSWVIIQLYMNILVVHSRFSSKLVHCHNGLTTTYSAMQCILRSVHAYSGLHQVAPTCSKYADYDMLKFTVLPLHIAAAMAPKSRAAVKVEELRKAPASSWLATFIAVQVTCSPSAFAVLF